MGLGEKTSDNNTQVMMSINYRNNYKAQTPVFQVSLPYVAWCVVYTIKTVAEKT